MKTVKSLEFGALNLRLEKEENVNNTRFTKYVLTSSDKTVMTSYHYKAVSDYFDMLVEEFLKKIA